MQLRALYGKKIVFFNSLWNSTILKHQISFGLKDGKKDGKGTWINSKGNKYEGEWKDGIFNGQGTFTWSNGNKYVGGWKGGLYNGQGTETFSNGNKLVGVFENGNPWNIIKYDKNGNIIEKIENGAKQE